MTELKKSKERETTEEEKRRQKMNIVQFYSQVSVINLYYSGMLAQKRAWPFTEIQFHKESWNKHITKSLKYTVFAKNCEIRQHKMHYYSENLIP